MAASSDRRSRARWIAERTRSAVAAFAGREPRSPEALAAFRNRRLQALIAHASEHVPFYSLMFAERGVRSEDVRGLRDLASLPIVDKRDFQRASASDTVARGLDCDGLVTRRTTGSTGQPMSIRRTWLEERTLGAYRWRALSNLGATRSDRFVEIEEPLAEDSGDATRLHALLQRTGLYRQRRLDALADPELLLSQLMSFRPDVVAGYAGVVARLAETVHRSASGPRRLAVRPRLVAVHSDTLTAQMRRSIAAAFEAPVYSIYDCNECNVVAWECPSTGRLHTCDDTVITEVIKPDGSAAKPGETGEVVLTALHSFAMPFIRYRIGDVVVQGEQRCPCGSPFGAIEAVQGRMFDYFPLADGRTIHPYELVNIIGARAPWIAEYRIVQETRDRIRLRMRVSRPPSETESRELERAIGEFLGSSVRFHCGVVEEFEAEPGAKTRVCRSLVRSEYDPSEHATGEPH